jgi:hypothetical protein
VRTLPDPAAAKVRGADCSTEVILIQNNSVFKLSFNILKQCRGVWAAEFGWFGRCFTQPEHHAKV